MRLRKRFFGLLSTASLLGMLIVPATAATNAYAVGCYAESCSGLDPIQEGCSADAVTIYQLNNVGFWGEGTLQLRFSVRCQAAWAKVFNDGFANNDIASVQNTEGWDTFRSVDYNGGDAYTDMVNDLGSIHSEACITHNNSNNSTCTSWF